ncbi:MAG: threonylcarbamoyl-AMP synthase [Methanotrichaceae archaeon]|nr:threonylcarbamoyl-AMP synthase [Methanotrichaceae archaeon]
MTAEAAEIIIGGGVVIYPTETVYGLGAGAFDRQAVLRVFEIKKRPLSMPITLAVSSLEMMGEVSEIGDEDLELLKRLLPGPVTVLVRKKDVVPDLLTAGSPLVGIRFPDHAMALEMIAAAGPITSTSANITGQPAPASPEEISDHIRKNADLMVDGGRCRYAEPSTLLDLKRREIIRPGAGLKEVQKAIS